MRIRTLVLILLFCCFDQVSAQAQAWTDFSDLPAPRFGHVAVAREGSVDQYVIGGHSGTEIFSDVWQYNGTNWNSGPNPMLLGCWAAASAVVGDKVHVIGGSSTGNPVMTTVQTYDMATQSWAYSLSIPSGLIGARAVYADDRIWVFGGAISTDGGGGSDQIIYSNPLTPSAGAITSWAFAGIPLPGPRVFHSLVENDGKIYVIGGRNTYHIGFTTYDSIIEYDIATGVSTTLSVNLPVPSSRHASVMFGNRVFTFGGRMTNGTDLATTVVFDPSVPQVQIGTPVPGPIYSLRATTRDDFIYVTGGVTNPGVTLRSCRVYNPEYDGFGLFTVGGTVSGLIGQLTLQNNGDDDITITTDGAFTFTNKVADGATYTVTVLNEPQGQSCVILNGSGTMGSSNVTDISVACTNDPPTITSILDVPNDQGRQVRLRWERTLEDSPAADVPVESYSIFRRIDSGLKQSETGEVVIPDLQFNQAAAYPPGDWDFVKFVPAFQEEIYSTIVPTLADSTVTTGIAYSVFFVRAATGNPALFFDSEPDSGYSVDR